MGHDRLGVKPAQGSSEKTRAIGLMSGTSVDGIDAALVEIEGCGPSMSVELLAFRNFKHTQEMRERILELCVPESSTVDKLCSMNFALGELFADAALSVIREANFAPCDIDVIGSHGQTVYHIPPPADETGLRVPSTLQIGEASVIAERTGITTVSNFRTRDMAAGGHGAPLVPYADYLLFGHPTKTRVVQNIGGIANMTILPRGSRIEDVTAFDLGPGNMLIDGVVSILSNGTVSFDEGGQIAARGKANSRLVEELMNHPFVQKAPPKTTGREEFGMEFVGKIVSQARAADIADEDLVASVTAFTARSIAWHLETFVLPRHGLDELIVGGGGAYNTTLISMIREHLGQIPVVTLEHYGMSSDAKEAIAFAIMARETINGRPSNVPSATGARRRVVLGSITPGHREVGPELAK